MKSGKQVPKFKKILILTLCLMLVTAAVFGGFALAQMITGKNGTADASGKKGNNGNGGAGTVIEENRQSAGENEDGQNPQGQAGEGGTEGKSSVAVLNRTPVEVIYDLNSETGRIEEILIGILRSIDGKIDYIRIDTEVVYTMSSALYTSLTPGNATLPQMITFSELYRYYHNDKAFDAGRLIISEMLSFNIQFYTAMPDYRFEKLFSVTDDGEGVTMEYNIAADSAYSEYGTPGSAKGVVEACLEDCVTNWAVSERLRYLDVLDSLKPEDVSFIEAPVYEYNESSTLDTDATGRILYEILY